ncbi:LCP family protein [Candidatus Gottesmanbacteria bacterium]|nr:LCP family protein [Candidatus Gottesmanbacteria bacterium]
MLEKNKRVLSGFINKYSKAIKLVVIFLFALFLILLVLRILNIFKTNKVTPSLITSFLNVAESPLKSIHGRTNFILLGVPGKKHEGIDLTDTIIFVSVDVSTKDMLLISVPRDIWIPSMKDKINTAYHYGEEAKEGGGFTLTKSVVEEVLGQPIHYALLVDFDGFVDLVDILGGLDVNVENSFVDEKFPIPGLENELCSGDPEYKCRYETIQFSQGLQHMDGITALKYVRSRNATGEEGTDFARSRRQKQVLLAFQQKLLSLDNLSPGKAKEIIDVVRKTIKTDLSLGEAAYLTRFGLGFNGAVRSIPLDWGNPDLNQVGFLVNPPVEKYQKWVLEPRSGNFAEIQSYINCFISDPACTIAP